MNDLQLNCLTGNPIPIPYYSGSGINLHLLHFLTKRFYHPTSLPGKVKKVGEKRIYDIAQNIKFMLNCIDNEISFVDENGHLQESGSINYLNINYHQLKQVVAGLHNDWGWKGQSIKNYIAPLRQFYEYLRSEGVVHNMTFEEKQKVNWSRDQDGDFLSHTKKSYSRYEYFVEPLIPNEWCEYSDDYRGKVISMSQFKKLYIELEKQDPVYAVMAATMLQTFLRIGGVVQIPVKPDNFNTNWKRYGQMDASIGFQELHYRNKGGSRATCLIHIETMKLIHEKYIIPYRSERQELYKKHYCNSEHAKKLHRTELDSFLWLNKNGKPVSIPELQEAFNKASKILEFHVTPHFMRHTGATQLLYHWGKANKTHICEMHKSTIHSFLKHQLGHRDLETTMYYIRTIEKLMGERVYVEFFPASLSIEPTDNDFIHEVKSAYNRAMELHFS
ncbi:hypothetical protein [Pseudoalteromonas sp. GB43]